MALIGLAVFGLVDVDIHPERVKDLRRCRGGSFGMALMRLTAAGKPGRATTLVPRMRPSTVPRLCRPTVGGPR
jgi:hypothetical protein